MPQSTEQDGGFIVGCSCTPPSSVWVGSTRAEFSVQLPIFDIHIFFKALPSSVDKYTSHTGKYRTELRLQCSSCTDLSVKNAVHLPRIRCVCRTSRASINAVEAFFKKRNRTLLTFRGSAPKSWFLAVVLRQCKCVDGLHKRKCAHGRHFRCCWLEKWCPYCLLFLFCCVFFFFFFHKKGGLGTGGIEGKRRDIYQRYRPARARHPVDDPALPSLSTSLASLTSLPFVFFLFIFVDLINVHSLLPYVRMTHDGPLLNPSFML